LSAKNNNKEDRRVFNIGMGYVHKFNEFVVYGFALFPSLGAGSLPQARKTHSPQTNQGRWPAQDSWGKLGGLRNTKSQE